MFAPILYDTMPFRLSRVGVLVLIPAIARCVRTAVSTAVYWDANVLLQGHSQTDGMMEETDDRKALLLWKYVFFSAF